MTLARFAALLSCLAIFSCQVEPGPAPTRPSEQGQTASAARRTITNWARYLADVIKQKSVLPPQAARSFAYATRAMQFAIDVQDGVDGNDEAAAVVASAAVLARAVPDAKTGIYNHRDAELRRIADSSANIDFAKSTAQGQIVAEQVANELDNDGFTRTRSLPFIPANHATAWAPTGVVRKPLEPFWGELSPLSGNDTTTRCAAIVGPPAVTTLRAEAEAVVAANNVANADYIAYYWSDAPARTTTPAGHWLEIAAQLADDNDLPFAGTVTLLANVSAAMHDALIVAWHLKYQHQLLRPVTYIRKHLDPTWRPRLITPAFPEYVSGHAAASAAAAYVLENTFGTQFAFVDRTRANQTVFDSGEDPHTLAAQAFASIGEAATQAADSRLYGGIHFPMGNRGGSEAGKCAAGRVLAQQAPSNGLANVPTFVSAPGWLTQ